MTLRCVAVAVCLASSTFRVEAAVPSITEIHANPMAAYQGIWESRFCSKDFQWRVEGNAVRMHRAESSRPATDYDNRYPVGATIMFLNELWDKSERGVRLYATIVDPRSGYQSKGHAAALTSYESAGIRYLSFNEMIRVDEKLRQCGMSAAKAAGATPAKEAARTSPASAKAASAEDSPFVAKSPTASQLQYEREMESYKDRLAEIERIKADNDAKIAQNERDLAAKRAAADRAMAEHRRKVEAAAAARRKYEDEMAAYNADLERRGQCRTIDRHGRTADCRPTKVKGE